MLYVCLKDILCLLKLKKIQSMLSIHFILLTFLDRVSSLFSWLQEQGYTPENQYVLTEQRYLLTSQEHNEKNLLSCLRMVSLTHTNNTAEAHTSSNQLTHAFCVCGYIVLT